MYTRRCCCCSTADERDPESEEVLAEQLLRLTSREYLDCLGSLLKEKRAADAAAAVADEMEEDAPPAATHSGGNVLQFSELGLSILRAPVRAAFSYIYMPGVSGQISPELFLHTDTPPTNITTYASPQGKILLD